MYLVSSTNAPAARFFNAIFADITSTLSTVYVYATGGRCTWIMFAFSHTYYNRHKQIQFPFTRGYTPLINERIYVNAAEWRLDASANDWTKLWLYSIVDLDSAVNNMHSICTLFNNNNNNNGDWKT